MVAARTADHDDDRAPFDPIAGTVHHDTQKKRDNVSWT